jgi:hypothetical protein
VEINKETAVSYIRSDIEALSEQSDAKEIHAYVNRIRGQLGLLSWTKTLSLEEAAALEDEMAKARSTAAGQMVE